MGTSTIHRTAISVKQKRHRKNGKGGSVVRAICTNTHCSWEYEAPVRQDVKLAAAEHEFDSAVAAGNTRTARREQVTA